jgi:hypothetical protein
MAGLTGLKYTEFPALLADLVVTLRADAGWSPFGIG